MKPWRTLVFIVSVLLLLAVFSFIVPENGFKLTSNFSIRFSQIEDILNPKKIEYADISEIVKKTDSLIVFEEEKLSKNTNAETAITRDTVKADARKLRSNIYRLQYPDGDRSNLYHFFRQLKDLKKNNDLIRIIHYGDSQIEGDRISSGIRNSLQDRFGGKGPGMFQLVDITKTIAVNRESSPNWIRYTILENKKHDPGHKKYGALLSFCRFAPYPDDSLPGDTTTYSSWLKLSKSNLTYANTRDFGQLRLFYGYNDLPFTVQILDKEGNQLDKDSILPRQSATTLVWKFDESPDEIRLEFSGNGSPDIYGIAMDGNSGVAVDNVALRGSAGLDFTKSDMSFLAKMYNYLNVKLLILEFGVNVVPNVVDDYGYYERWFYGNLSALKRFNPELSIIVIGLSDMARKSSSGDYYESYPNIEKIRDA